MCVCVFFFSPSSVVSDGDYRHGRVLPVPLELAEIQDRLPVPLVSHIGELAFSGGDSNSDSVRDGD